MDDKLDKPAGAIVPGVVANTFRTISIDDPPSAAVLPFDDFVRALLQKLERLKKERSAFYEDRRRDHNRWANGARALLALLGSATLLLTGLAAAIRFAPEKSLLLSVPVDDRASCS